MASNRTVDLLPEIFRTPANQRFLSATLDQMSQEPNLVKSRGFVGRRVGSGVRSQDNYITEPTAERVNYQLEPGVAFLKPDTNQVQDAVTYPGLLSALNLQGATTQQQDRIWASEYYAWDSFCDIDKFVNYSQYYWLPYGPDSVTVSNESVPMRRTFDVDRAANDAYTFDQVQGKNPKIRLVRGGNYTFDVDQPGSGFWIQSEPGVSGSLSYAPNLSSRDVLGVENNGDDSGSVTFRVPLRTAQDFFYALEDIGTVSLVTDFKITEINNQYVDAFLTANPSGIDGITNLDSRTVLFVNPAPDTIDGGWELTTRFDPLPRNDSSNSAEGSFDSTTFDQTTYLETLEQRYSIWRITYVPDTDGRNIMRVSQVRTFPELSKVTITFGTTYSNTQWYKTAEGTLQQIPALTAVQNILYYQDARDPRLFGEIELLDPDSAQPLDVNDIVGARSYVSPNGVTFTNGLKVRFDSNVIPAEYAEQEYYVEGVGSGPGVGTRVGFVNGEAYYGAYHTVAGQKIVGVTTVTGQFQPYIYDNVQESLINAGSGTVFNGTLPVSSTPGAIDGNGIRLIPVTALITPETYTRSATIPYDITGFDDTPFDSSLNAPTVQDYITVNRSSRDLNAWSRSNRWFHIDVIQATAQYTNQPFVVDNAAKARRPIIEFRANLRLFDMGTQSRGSVSLVDTIQTDAFTNVAGKTTYTIDGVELMTGMRVIFSADQDPEVRNRIYRVEMIDPDGDVNSPQVINLVDDSGAGIQIDNTTVTTTGLAGQGTTYRYDGTAWQPAQQKTNVNQPPRFDIFDNLGRSLADTAAYPSSSFRGSRLFGYADSSSTVIDPVLGFALNYLNINNIGDIQFSNYFFNDTFVYVDVNNRSQTLDVSVGSVRQYLDRADFSSLVGWMPAATENISRQILRFVYDGNDLVMDVPVRDQAISVVPTVRLYADGLFVDPNEYTVTTTDKTVIRFINEPAVGSSIEAQIISDQVSRVAYFQVPMNLENNAMNQNSSTFTLGSVRRHYESVAENLVELTGKVNGANNSRDLGNILAFGERIVQHSSPITLAATFLRRDEYEFFDALRFNAQEYEKYKARLLDAVVNGDFVNNRVSQILDQAIAELAEGRSDNMPFYWSDMLPAGEVYDETVYTITPISTQTFDTLRAYDFSASNYQGLLVYLNDRLLTKDTDYAVSTTSTTITVSAPLIVGDRITVREYASTYGSYVPNTPTKLGLYPAFRPQKYQDRSYRIPTTVIQGHDGSITVGYGDIRDDIILEFETRIYNNLKIHSTIPLVVEDVVPGRFRNTDYSLAEINTILSQDFLSWIGWNRLDFTSQTYSASDAFTYNYNQSSDKIDGSLLPGAWRGIYEYFYDTISPTETPWEMLGLTEKPTWWEAAYGPAPYTEGNLVLWEDLANGLIQDPANPRVDPRYRRPQLLSVIPAGSEGALLDPLTAVVGNYDDTSFRRSWTFGDNGPAEYAWRTSSSYPFAVMRLLALTKPAQFFSLFADRDRYQYDTGLEQYLWDERYRLDANDMGPLYGSGISKASYLDWIIDYNRTRGIDSTEKLLTDLANTDVRLCWRVAGFTDKKYLKIYTERSTPSGENLGFMLPDESYQILLYDNVPQAQSRYSSVIVQKTNDGWRVQGYDISQPYFEIRRSRVRGVTRTFSAGGVTATVPVEYTDDVTLVPYGYTFTSRNSVCDFLLSYGQHLLDQGFDFSTKENGYIMDWNQMCQEFLYWSNQGWVTGSLINLNPASQQLSASRAGLTARSLAPSRLQNLVLNQNRQSLAVPRLMVNRLANNIELIAQSSDAISFASLDFTAYEHLVVLDNRSLFNDLIYDPVTGSRQSRVLISGWITGDWDGTVNAPGFVINQDNIEQWRSDRVYTKGDIVIYKDRYWSARYIVQPSATFNFNDWLESDYEQVKTGLLPNAALSSLQLANAYGVYAANLESDLDLFSYGLIGFRPRQYMQALSLDDVSQVNLYRQFLGTKGTRRSAEIFSLADIGKETAEYDIYEYWAMLQSQYGANANRRYIEILLDQAQLPSDPSLVQVIEPQQTSVADQTVLLQDLWKQSYKVPNTNIFQSREIAPGDNTLPTAGYVDLDDVDFSVFDLDAISDIVPVDALDDTTLDRIGEGTSIWVAKINDHDWNVYRCQAITGEITQASDNLDGTLRLKFNVQHGLTTGDPVIIRFFDPVIDGSYRVRSVPDLYSITVPGQLPDQITQITGVGITFRLESTRIHQPSDIVNLDFAKNLRPGTKIWVDNVGDGRWAVLENTDPYTIDAALIPRVADPATGYGTAVSQGLRNLTALIGAPTYGNTGAVYSFVRQPNDEYAEDTVLLFNTANVSEFGSSIDIGNDSYGVIGAPGSYDDMGLALVVFTATGQSDITQQQILLPPDGDYANARFGEQVTMSLDEKWLYVAASGTDKVYAYNRVDVQSQSVSYRTDGSTYGNSFPYSDSVVIDANYPDQLVVTLNGQIQQSGIDFVLVSGNLVLNTVPADDQLLSISRRTSVFLDQFNYYNMTASGGFGTDARFAIDVRRGVYNATITSGGEDYELGDILTITGDRIGGATPANDLRMQITRTGNLYNTITEVESGGSILLVNSVDGLEINQELFKTSGTGSIASGTTIIDINTDQVTASQIPSGIVANTAVVRTTVSIGATADVGGTIWANTAPATVDGVTLLGNDLVLVLNQTNLAENGLYQVFQPGTGNNGRWYRVLGGLDIDQRVIYITGPLSPESRIPQAQAMQFRDTYWRMNTRKEVSLSTPITASGLISFFASPGPVTEISLLTPAAGINNTASFDLRNNFYQVDGITSFRIVVDGYIYVPTIDYTLAGNTVTFTAGSRFPEPGAVIAAVADTYFTHVDTISADELGIASDAEFGFGISTTSDGRQLVISAPYSTANSQTRAGNVYVFDRSMQAYIYQDDSDAVFVTELPQQGPTTVKLNGRFLLNNDGNINGNFTSAAPDGSSLHVVTVTDPVLTPGDRVEVETNQFRLIQVMQAATPTAQARYGFRVDACVNDCSIYVSAPYDSQVLPDAGMVEFWTNQARVFGTITTTRADPVLTAGDAISVNGQYVRLSQPATWNNGRSWTAGTFVIDSGNIYRARVSVPLGAAVTNTVYWSESSWLAVLAADITQPVASGGVPNVNAQVVGEYLAISVKNFDSVPALDKITVLPGTGTLFADLGIPVYARLQELRSPQPQSFSHFGYSMFVSDDTLTLAVGAPDGSMIKPMTLDLDSTTFDAGTTLFNDTVTQSGQVFVYDQLPAADASVSNPPQFVFGQQIIDPDIRALDRFGSSVDLTTGTLLIGAPGNDSDGSTQDNVGRVSQFRNLENQPAWRATRLQQPSVDVNLFNRAFIYDRITQGTRQFLDIIDPLQGRLLGVVEQNIDYISAVDPAAYNSGPVNNYGNFWAEQRLGNIWWDITNARFLDPNQNDVEYASRRWAQLFPGSTVDIYQWIESDVPPNEYTGSGSPRTVGSFTVKNVIDDRGIIDIRYYFWVAGLDVIDVSAGKTLSINNLQRYIENPRGSGIPYIAPINSSTLALYNALPYVSGLDTVLHVEFDQQRNDDVVHTQYHLVPVGRANGFLTDTLYTKLIDSFAGVDSRGGPVPDPNLSPSERYGVQTRPRQSFFVDRIQALQNYLVATNTVLATLPISENRQFSLLNSNEVEPAASARRDIVTLRTNGNGTSFLVVDVAFSIVTGARVTVNGINIPITAEDLVSVDGGAKTQINFPQTYSVNDALVISVLGAVWNKRLLNYTQLTYQDISAVDTGYRYLVATDENNNGLWTIYEVTQSGSSRSLLLVRVQTFDTRLYWEYINWYALGYSAATRVTATVPNSSALDTLVVDPGSVVKVTANAQGRFELYVLESTGWRRVGLENGTIRFRAELWDYNLGRFGFDSEVFDAQYYDENPFTETRQIIRAINEELLIGDLLTERNNLLILTFRYILTEQQAPDWLIKTSLIDVDHTIRDLVPYPTYKQDNQDFVLEYIKEVKPYHSQIREFNLKYKGFNESLQQIDDFDLPAFYDANLDQFISPVLDNTGELSSTSSRPSTDPVWQQWPYSQWYNNYTLSVDSVQVVDQGSGYTVAPTVEVTGAATRPAVMIARITSDGRIFSIEILDSGAGYVTTPSITLRGGNGTGARAVARMKNDLVRRFKTTIKFDRYQYQSDIQDWQPNAIYENGDRVRYADRAWQAASTDSSVIQTATFDPTQWTQLNAADLSGIDRTQGFYAPDQDQVGRDLAQLITGIDYPGVQVQAVDFQSKVQAVGNGVITVFSFAAITIPFDRQVPQSQRVLVKVNGLTQRLDIDYTISFAPNRVTFAQAPASDADITIEQIDPFELIGDVRYRSAFTDTFLGTDPAPSYSGSPSDSRGYGIEVEGGAFVDTYSSHAPEELLPGAMFDTVDLRVYQTPGSDWDGNGHGFPVETVSYTYDSASPEYSWDDLLDYPATVNVFNSDTGVLLAPDVDFVIDWPARTVTVTGGISTGQDLLIRVSELGGGNQIYRRAIVGDDVPDLLIVPVGTSVIDQIVLFVNGETVSGVTWQEITASSTQINLPTEYTSSDLLVLTILGTTANNYDWSAPITEWFTADGSLEFDLVNSVAYSNPANMIVTLNGRRMRPWEASEYTSDATTIVYALPNNGGIDQGIIADNEVFVYVNDVPLRLSTDYVVDPYDGSSDRTVTLTNPGQDGDRIVIAVSTASPYLVVDDQLVFKSGAAIRPVNGDIVSVTTFNDTREQRLLTQVWRGPTRTVLSVLTEEGFDTDVFDPDFITQATRTGDLGFAGSLGVNQAYEIRTVGTTDFTLIGAPDNNIGTKFVATGAGTGTGTTFVIEYVRDSDTDSGTGTTGSFDFATGVVVEVNRFDTGRVITDDSLLRVSLDGIWLIEEQDYTTEGSVVILRDPVIGSGQIVAITSLAQSVLPGAMEFRIFKNMRDSQITYRITDDTSTTLTQELASTDAVIHVENASLLPEPDVENNRFAFVSINGERIAYRERNTVTNTLTSLRRGVSGTAAASHAAGSRVIDMSSSNELLSEYQDLTISDSYIDPANTTDFVSNKLRVSDTAVALLGGFVTVSLSQAASVQYQSNGTDVVYNLPEVPGLEPEAITGGDVRVFVNGVQLDINVDYTLDPYDGSSLVRTVTLDTAPTSGDIVAISVVTDAQLQDSSSYVIDSIDPVAITLSTAPAAGQILDVSVTQITGGSVQTASFTTNGITPRFSTDIVVVLREAVGYLVTDYSPITVAYSSPPAAGQIVLISTQNSARNANSEFVLGDGATSVFSSTIDLGRLVSVYRGGQILSASTYTVLDLNPVQVTLASALPQGQELLIALRQGRSWYQPSTTTASNGESLQVTNTRAARFLRGF